MTWRPKSRRLDGSGGLNAGAGVICGNERDSFFVSAFVYQTQLEGSRTGGKENQEGSEMTYEDRLAKWQRTDTLVSIFVVLTVLLPTFLWWVGILPVVFPEWFRHLCLATWFLSMGFHRCFKPISSGTDVETATKKKRKLVAAFYINVGLAGLSMSLAELLELKS